MAQYQSSKEIIEKLEQMEFISVEEVIKAVRYSYVKKGKDPESDEKFLSEVKRYEGKEEGAETQYVYVKGFILVQDLLNISLYPHAPWVKELCGNSTELTLEKALIKFESSITGFHT